MRWHFWNQHKPDFYKPLVVYWINAVGTGFFLEGEYDPRGVFVELDGTTHSGMSDGTRWIYKDQFVEFLSEYWDN